MNQPGQYNYFFHPEARLKYLTEGDMFHLPGEGDFLFSHTTVSPGGNITVLAYGGKWVTRRPHPKKPDKMVWVSKGKRTARTPLTRTFTMDQMTAAREHRREE